MNTKTSSVVRKSARERLLDAADELFYDEGINTVGIDRVIEHAGVAKASLYDCFGSKEELVRSYLQRRHELRRARVTERLTRYERPRDKILSLFDALEEAAANPQYRGCAFTRAGVETRPSSTVKAAVDESRAWNQALCTRLATEAGAADAALLGQQLVALYDGALVAVSIDGNPGAVAAARSAAMVLLSAATAGRA